MTEHDDFAKYVDLQIATLVAQITHERELREQSEEAMDNALKLQAIEYGRRLDGLASASERSDTILRACLPAATYEDFQRRYLSTMERVWSRLEEYQGAKKQTVYLIGLALALLTFLMKFVPVSYGIGK